MVGVLSTFSSLWAPQRARHCVGDRLGLAPELKPNSSQGKRVAEGGLLIPKASPYVCTALSQGLCGHT